MKRTLLKVLAVTLIVATCVCFLFSCKEKEETPPGDPVTLTVSGGWTDCRAIELVAAEFKKVYPNVTVNYEYVQSYFESLPKRMTGEEAIDIFFTSNILYNTAAAGMKEYALDLETRSDLDLSNTFYGLIDNFRYADENGKTNELYAVPVGAEMRGMYVNKTLLASVGINSVPTNQSELLDACATLKAEGYIPFHGNPANFGALLVYPWICNNIANAEESQNAYAAIESRTLESMELFREPYEFLYNLVENDYYDYKSAQDMKNEAGVPLNIFKNMDDEDYAKYFFNIQNDNGNSEDFKADDTGLIAFMPAPMSMGSLMQKTKEDYHSNIDYAFIPAPVGVDGGFVYLSPATGIAVNKNSVNLDYAVKFLDFLFRAENNEIFSEAFNTIPNSKEAFSYISELYDVPGNRISHLGEVTFSYNFYGVLTDGKTGGMVDLTKANNPKYMDKSDPENPKLYSFEYYWNIVKGVYEEK